ncbi:hypothetical protein DXG03_000034 [Asterophora parasitica]|uniref:PI31 proteasome regulator N-terminal domain-containing protein n=1 Tax=Asterophora parasitica TaxID=117018 RepID=A0A9P7KFL7_9AGAR|nr:hypothetical protein DXG03_000034 [Asterophora parasitica]
MTTNDILDPSALLSLLPTLLPSASRALASPQDALASLLHTVFSAVAFRLVAADETSSSNSTLTNVLPEGWNENGPGNYTFRYRHDQSSLEFILKVLKLGGRTVINAIAVESDKVASLDISTNDFISPSFFPHDLGADSSKPLVHGFISSNRVADLTSQIKLKILQKLIPGLRKDGYTEEVTETFTNAGGSNPPQAHQPPARPQPHAPSFEHYRPPHIPPDNPLSIGRRDLDPFPQNPFAPPPLFPGSDGMFVGPDHPIFGGGRGRIPFGEQRPWGGDGYLPPMGAPPGARPAPRPKQRVEGMTVRELQDLHSLNAKILSSPGASTSTYVDRVMTQQAQVEGRLIELEGMETINVALKKTRLKNEGDMNVNAPSEPPVSRTIEAKRKALHKFAPVYGVSVPGTLSLQEAMNLEQQAHMREKERLQRIAEKKRRLGMPVEGEVLTRKEREARIWAFMNHKPTDSDMEDDVEDESDEDDDPASWFEDDQDDGRKGQDIIEPDVEDLSDIIRVDESRIHYSTFYQPRDDGD